jgi:hypothetical protein
MWSNTGVTLMLTSVFVGLYTWKHILDERAKMEARRLQKEQSLRKIKQRKRRERVGVGTRSTSVSTDSTAGGGEDFGDSHFKNGSNYDEDRGEDVNHVNNVNNGGGAHGKQRRGAAMSEEEIAEKNRRREERQHKKEQRRQLETLAPPMVPTSIDGNNTALHPPSPGGLSFLRPAPSPHDPNGNGVGLGGSPNRFDSSSITWGNDTSGTRDGVGSGVMPVVMPFDTEDDADFQQQLLENAAEKLLNA